MKSLPRLGFLLAALLGARPAAPAADARNEAPVVMDSLVVDATKTHVLFMGADIAVHLDRDNYPVRNVIGSAWIISINGDEREIASNKGQLDMKITPDLKLTEGTATITGFKREAAYSYDNDPSVRITRGLTHAGEVTADLQSIAADAEHAFDIQNSTGQGVGGPYGGMRNWAQSDNQFNEAAFRLAANRGSNLTHPTASGGPGGDQALAMAKAAASVAVSMAASAAEPEGKIATSGIDGMEINFTVASTKAFNEPYVVTMTRFRAPGAKTGEVQNLVYARSIDPIDSHLSSVHFTEDGFPFNYEVVDFQLHLYDKGVEIATNLSANRVELTRGEAFDYIKMEYLNSHRHATTAPTPAMGQLPADFPSRLASGKYALPFYVQVSKEGVAHQVFADAACRQRITDPFVEQVASNIRFKPALDSGRPIDGVAELNLNKLVL